MTRAGRKKTASVLVVLGNKKGAVGVLGSCANIYMSVSPEPNGKALLYEK